MASQQQPARPWFRLPSIARPAVTAAPTPEPQPRPPLVRPAFRPVVQAPPQPQPQEPTQPQAPAPAPTNGVSSVSTSPVGRTSVPSSPVQRTSPTSGTLPATTTTSVPSSPQTKAFSASVPTSPSTKPASSSTVSSPVKAAATSSMPTSPAKTVSTSPAKTVSTSPTKTVSTSPTKTVSTSPTIRAPIFKAPTVPITTTTTTVTATARVPSPTSASPKTIKPTVQTPPQSPKPKPTAPPPSPLVLPPPQLKPKSQPEPKIPVETEQKGVLFQRTIENHKSWVSSPEHKKIDEGHKPSIAFNHGPHHHVKHEEPKDVETKKKSHQKKFSSDSDEVNMKVITIAGENKGAFMEVIKSPMKDGNSHFLYKKGNTKAESDGQGWHSYSSSSSGDEGSSKMKDKSNRAKAGLSPAMGTAFMNSNVQGVNNSIVFNSSCTHHDPGVHLALSRKPSGNGFHIKDNGHGVHHS